MKNYLTLLLTCQGKDTDYRYDIFLLKWNTELKLMVEGVMNMQSRVVNQHYFLLSLIAIDIL